MAAVNSSKQAPVSEKPMVETNLGSPSVQIALSTKYITQVNSTPRGTPLPPARQRFAIATTLMKQISKSDPVYQIALRVQQAAQAELYDNDRKLAHEESAKRMANRFKAIQNAQLSPFGHGTQTPSPGPFGTSAVAAKRNSNGNSVVGGRRTRKNRKKRRSRSNKK